MTDEMLDFTNLLIVKNHLGMVSRKDLVGLYQDIDDYVLFIDMFAYLTECDSGFLYLDSSIPDKVLDIIQLHRFDVKDSELSEIINDIIEYLNRLNNNSSEYKKIVLDSYFAYHEDLREATFRDCEALLASIGYDALVLKAIVGEGEFDSLSNNKFTVMSLNYLVKVCPELFQDEERKSRALELLDRCMHGNSIFDGCKRHAKMIKVKINELDKKKE